MTKTILFEGKVTLGDQLVDFRIYKETEEGITLYSYDVDPEVRDNGQIGIHRGESQRAKTLEGLLSRFKLFQREFSKIAETRKNENF